MRTHESLYRPARRSFPEWIDALPLALLALLAWMILQAPGQINHDCAYVLGCAQMLVTGQLPYVGFIDVNPPLIFYLNALPVWASRLTGLSLPLAFSLFALAQLALSSAFVLVLLRRPDLNLKPAARFALLFGWILCSLFVYATGDFGQRDHLVIVNVFPFILLRIIRYYEGSIPAWIALALGLMTGIGMSLKPNFFFIVLVPEAVALAHTRRLRAMLAPEIWACAGFCALYIVHFFFLPSIVRAELFGRWLPFFARYYGTINVNLFEHMLAQPAVVAAMTALAVIAVLAVIIVRRRGTSSLRIEMLAGLSAGGFLSYWIQQKGYSYHALPAKLSLVMLALFASLWLYDEIVNRKERVPFRRSLAAAPAVLIIAALSALTVRAYGAGRAYVTYESFAPYREAILAHSERNDAVLFLNTTLFPAFPTLIQTGRLPASRYLTTFPLAGIYYGANAHSGGSFVYRTKEAMPAEERRFLDELELDIRTNAPAMIFIHSGAHCSAMPEGFNMDEYFHKTEFIAHAMSAYAPAGRVGDFSVYIRHTHTALAGTH